MYNNFIVNYIITYFKFVANSCGKENCSKQKYYMIVVNKVFAL